MTDGTCDLLCLDLPRAEAVRAARPDDGVLAETARRARALSDPTRLTVALALREGGELCVCDLAWITGRSDRLTSHHARALRDAGLVTSRRDGKMVLYRISASGSALLAALLPGGVRA